MGFLVDVKLTEARLQWDSFLSISLTGTIYACFEALDPLKALEICVSGTKQVQRQWLSGAFFAWRNSITSMFSEPARAIAHTVRQCRAVKLVCQRLRHSIGS